MPLNDKELHLSTTSGQENKITFVIWATAFAWRGIFPIQWFIPLRPQLINSLMEFKT